MGRRCDVLVLDNTRAEEGGYFTPRLIECISKAADVRVVRTRHEALRAARERRPDAIVLSGSQHTLSENIPKPVLAANAALMQLGIPVLGVCFGMQVMALVHGGSVQRLKRRCVGVHAVVTRASSLFDDDRFDTYHEHVDAVLELPHGFEETARLLETDGTRAIVAFEHPSKRLFGVQFHPEADPELARRILARFLSECRGSDGRLAAGAVAMAGLVVGTLLAQALRG